MEVTKIQLIQIKWEGPFTFGDLPSLKNEETDYGIYQVYGRHLVYGDDVLLYIGQANQQAFGTRIMQHAYWLEDDYSFYVGRLSGTITPSYDSWHSAITFAESFLINTHAPAFNTSNIGSIKYEEIEHMRILNLGKYKNLLPELSGARWMSDFDEVLPYIYKSNNRSFD